MSYKNTLQEFFQKKKLAPPTYETVRIGGDDHSPSFLSTVILPTGEKIRGDLCSNKKTAELNAAQKVVESNLFDTPDITEKFHLKRDLAIFVDLENKSNIIEELVKVIGHNTKINICAFAAHEHASLSKLKEKELDSVQIVEVPSTRRDGADIGLMISVGGFLFRGDYKDFIIVTSDHYGDALVDCIIGINKMWGWKSLQKPPRAACCRSLDRILESIKEYEN